jgi:prepilin-type N-terminal cleavage/methylation domain-containing protein/prepilin-type processing-associated H-X9-DG protein
MNPKNPRVILSRTNHPAMKPHALVAFDHPASAIGSSAPLPVNGGSMEAIPIASGPPRKEPSKRGFSLTELLVVIAIVVILAAIALVTVSRIKAKAGDAKCVSILRQLGVGVQLYAAENNGFIVPSHSPSFLHLLARSMNVTPEWSLREYEEWRCPIATEVGETSVARPSYAINRFLSDPSFVAKGGPSVRFASLPSGRRFVLIADQPLLNNEFIEYMAILQDPAFRDPHYFRHNGKMNVLWTDFSVSAIDKTKLLKDHSNKEKSLWRFQ